MKKPFFHKLPQGKPFIEDGVWYYHLLPLWKRPLYAFVKVVQMSLYFVGLKWHDFLSDECCPDFGCCQKPKYGKAWFKDKIEETF